MSRTRRFPRPYRLDKGLRWRARWLRCAKRDGEALVPYDQGDRPKRWRATPQAERAAKARARRRRHKVARQAWKSALVEELP